MTGPATPFGGRLHARTLDALVDAPEHLDGHLVQRLRAPQPGWFVPAVEHGDLLRPGGVLGRLEILGAPYVLLATAQAAGSVRAPVAVAHPRLAPRAVDFRDVLVLIDFELVQAAAGMDAAAGADATTSPDGLVFRAPTSGRYYGRPAPDKPPFVAVGDELAPGATICLLEVMKTFHRVTYGGAGLPERACVRQLLVADGADVTAGEPLLALA